MNACPVIPSCVQIPLNPPFFKGGNYIPLFVKRGEGRFYGYIFDYNLVSVHSGEIVLAFFRRARLVGDRGGRLGAEICFEI